jgi:hypothetical protein
LPAIQFVQDEYQVGKILALGIPIWASQSIIPVMLAVLSLRFLGKTWAFVKKAISSPIQIDKNDI